MQKGFDKTDSDLRKMDKTDGKKNRESLTNELKLPRHLG